MNPGSADLILFNGPVYSFDGGRLQKNQGIAIGDGRVLRIGSAHDVLGSAHSGTRQIDLQGRTVVPGFIDSHIHMSQIGLNLLGPDISTAKSIDDIQAVLAEAASKTPAGQWLVTGIVGESVISHELAEGRYPLAEELDAAAPNHPVCIRSFHVGILNSEAMRALGLSAAIAAPVGGAIGRVDTDAGELDGRFYETAWKTLVEPRLPKPSPEQRTAALALASRRLNAVGITQVCEHGIDWETWRAYEAAETAGRLSVRAFTHLHVGPGSGIEDDLEAIAEVGIVRRRTERRRGVRLAGVKTFIDGGVALGTACFRESYIGANGKATNGLRVMPPAQLDRIVAGCLEHGVQLSHHASGDAAIDQVLDAYERVGSAEAIRKNRFVMVHCQFPDAANMARMVEMGVLAAMQTLFLYNMGQGYLKYHGVRAHHAIPLRSMIEHGCVVGLGTDAPVNQYAPLLAVWHAGTRLCKATGEPIGAAEALSREQAVQAYTARNACFSFDEDRLGSLKVGQAADLAVLARDPFEAPVEQLAAIEVMCTAIAGKPVHGQWDARNP